MQNSNVELIKSKSISDEEYIILKKTYKQLFEIYLQNKTDLKLYDNKIKNSDLDFGQGHPAKINLINDLGEYIGLNYIFIINDFFVEKLSINDLNELRRVYQEKKYNLNTIKMIERTYKDVLNNNFVNGEFKDVPFNRCYGPMVPKNFALSDSLVIKIIFGKNIKQYNDDEYLANAKAKTNFLNILSNELKKEIEEKFGIRVTILREKIMR